MYSIGANPQQLAIMTRAFDEYCLAHSIADDVDRESVAFVVMALWSAIAGGTAEMMCSSGGSALSLNGMAVMYALMSVFHVSPWLTLLSKWRNDEGGRSST